MAYLEAATRGMESAPQLAYEVYRVSPDGPAKLTAKPVSALTFSDPGVELGVERCYDVRTVMTQGFGVVRECAVTARVPHAGRYVPAALAGVARGRRR